MADHTNLTPARLMDLYLTEVVGNGRLDLIAQIAHADMVDEANQAFGGPAGRDGLTAHVKGFRKNISALHTSVHQIVAATDEVMAHWSFSGTHDGPWLGVAATGRPIRGTVFSFFSLRDGRISRYRLWLHTDLNGSTVFDSAAATVLKSKRHE